VDAIAGQLRRVQSLVRRRSDAVARVIDRLAEERDVARAAQALLEGYASEARSRLLERDDVPLWRLGERSGGAGLGVEARAAQRYWLATLEAWASDSPGSLVLFGALLLGFGAATLALRRRSRGWSRDDPSRQAAIHVVSRPYSAALAFAIAVWVLSVGFVPSPVGDVLGLLAVVPALRLGLGLVSPALRPALAGIVGLSVLARMASLSPDGSLLRRLLLLGGALVALAGARVILRGWRRAPSGGWAAAARWGLELGAALLALSVAANLLGWVNLAQLLGDGTIRSAFAAVAWLVVAQAAHGLLPLIRSGGAAERLPLLARQGSRLEALASTAITLLALGLWAWGTLSRLGLDGLVRERVAGILAASFHLGGLEISVGAVLSALAILIATPTFSRALRVALQDEVLPRMQLPAGADNSVLTLVSYAVIGVGALLAAGAAGLASTQLAVVFGALSLGIGFGLQNVVNNFVSGLILIFERPIKVGDRLETTSHLGIVTRIGIRSSTVRTFDGAEVVVPNGDLISKEVINWTLSDQVRRVESSRCCCRWPVRRRGFWPNLRPSP
jgi:small-conductance mechanosensitive channel